MKKVLALFLVLALFSGSFQITYADSSDKVFFADNGSLGGWSGATASVDSSTKKTGSAAAKLVYTAKNCGTSFTISPFEVTDTEKMALQMWIKVPKNGGVPRLSVVMDISGKNVEAEMTLADYIGKSDKGRWTFLQIPLSAFGSKGKYWNNEKQQSEFPTLDWKKVKGIWFVHSNGGSGQYVCFVDDLKIVSKFDPADNTPKGGSDGVNEADTGYAEPENRLDENGNRILVTIYEDDTSIAKAGKWTNPKSAVKSNRRFKKDGAESLQAHYEANSDYGGLTWTLNKPVALG
ncbi:MAG: hypothetical protein IKV86_05110, partial [Clostridia bacterium]|nr:hypothetical protein [Clostridia bacterium]